MLRRNVGTLLVLTVSLWMLFVPAAGAYIDAGSVSVIFQAVVAGIAASWMFLKLNWQRVLNVFRSSDDDEDAVTPYAEGSDDAASTEPSEAR